MDSRELRFNSNSISSSSTRYILWLIISPLSSSHRVFPRFTASARVRTILRVRRVVRSVRVVATVLLLGVIVVARSMLASIATVLKLLLFVKAIENLWELWLE